MGRLFFLILFTLPSISSIFTGAAAGISRKDFPPGFIFGAGSSAYQVEGAAAEDGRKPSIWDTFTHAGKAADKKTGDVAADQYHKYKEDVKLMHEMGLDAYRLSISWSRLIPGKFKCVHKLRNKNYVEATYTLLDVFEGNLMADGRGPVNPKGLRYYNNLLDELTSYGIQPHVTLYHFDMPQALQDEYGGLLSPKIVADFTAYADICFKEFGDRVKYWTTFNEPNIEPILGYDFGIFPPAHCSYPFGFDCSIGDSTTEPYTSAHHMLLAHASVARLYKDKYQAQQHGYIGITLLGLWVEPLTKSPSDIAAAQRMLDFHIGWFMDPLVHGNYPAVMRKNVGSRLPHLKGNDSEQLKKSFDFIGFNHYSVFPVQDDPDGLKENERDYIRDISITVPVPFQQFAKSFIGLKDPQMPTTPWALQRLLDYIKVKYANPPIMIHENGYGEFDASFLNNEAFDDLDDAYRVEYIEDYLEGLLLSVRNGSNTRGYFVWSLLDCFETAFGYTARYGLYKVDFNNKDRKRYPRRSAHWYSSFLINSSAEMGKLSKLYSQ